MTPVGGFSSLRLIAAAIGCLLSVADTHAADVQSASLNFYADIELDDGRYSLILVKSPPEEGALELLTQESLAGIVRRAERTKKPVAIVFSGHTPTVAELALLKPLTNFRFFGCEHSAFKDDVVDAIVSLRTLERLGLGRLDVTEAGFAKLAGLSELRHLAISTEEPLTQSDHLWSNLRNSDFAVLGKATKLRRLHISAPIDDTALGHIGKLSSLEELILDRTIASKTGLMGLSGCVALKTLAISKHLVSLRFGGRTATEFDWSFVRALPKLESLSFAVTRHSLPSDLKMSPTSPIREIAGCKQLQKLAWHFSEAICADHLSDDAIRLLGAMPTLKEIDFGATPIYLDQIARLKLLKPEVKIEALGKRKRPDVEIQ